MTTATDVVVAGGGAAGLVAAARCREAGLEVIVVEAADRFGGATATDTGHLWLPATHVTVRGAGTDTTDAAAEYLDAALGPATASSTPERRAAFVATAGPLARWLEDAGVPLAVVRNRPDLHPDAPGARRVGRTLATQPFDRRALGQLRPLLRDTGYALELAPRSPRGLLAAAQTVARRAITPTRDLAEDGAALAGRLLLRADKLNAELWPESELVDLLTGEDGIAGVRVRRQGAIVELRARRGVILASGGFEGNAEWRSEHFPLPTDPSWTSGLAGNTGAGIRAAAAVGARLAGLDDAWWTIVARFGGRTYRMTRERSLPHGVIVDAAGNRFLNEAGPMPEGGRALYDRNRRVRAIPAYLIVDDRHRQRYRLGPWLPGSTPGLDADGVTKAQSLAELAQVLGIDAAGLIGSVVRFNGLAAKGRDTDFDRGASPVDRSQGDPLHRRSPNLGPIEKSPFWAVPVYPGDAGTKGGVLVDADARVLDAAGAPLPGLYATAGTAATLFARTAPGTGCALGSALVDAHRAAGHLAGAAPDHP